MAYSTINKSTLHQNTIIYTGNGNASRSITGVGFQPDWTWFKSRSGTNWHNLYDAVRGVTKALASNESDTEDTRAQGLTAFGSDGFTVGTDSNVNGNTNSLVAWNWKAGTTGSGTTTGSGYGKAYSYSVNTTAGFSIVTYKGNGTAGHTIPHHLGATPSFIIVKNRDTSSGAQWSVYHKDSFTSQSAPGVLYLNTTAGKSNDTNVWGNSTVTIDSTVFSVGDYDGTNKNDDDMIAYVFAEKTGYSKFGSYTGNSSSDGVFVYTGFKPSFVMVKNISASQSWWMWDNKRLGYNSSNYRLRPDTSGAESADNKVDFISNGFKFRDGDNAWNYSGNTFIYMAFGQSLVGSNNVPATAR